PSQPHSARLTLPASEKNPMKNSKWPLGALLLTNLLLLGCGSIQTEHSLLGTPRSRWSGNVTVVMEGQKPPEGVQEIAILQVAATGDQANMPNTIDALKARAAELGCNTVVNVRIDRGSAMSTTGVCGFVE
ncbi:MAG TPA: hypothetical protein VLC09_08850, partial [Polyangiaceae bacterium]|nr:hypothetical protein [Polyangiaceae bacterium]